jgi:hypothetical protein
MWTGIVRAPTFPAVRRIAVVDPIAADRRRDYADAYAVDLPISDAAPPETWLSAALSQLPPVVVWITTRLGFSGATANPLDGWQIRANGPDVLHLVAELPIAYVDFVGRNASPTYRTLTTLLTYRRPWLGRLVWWLVGPVHRRTARWILATSLRTVPVRA